MPERTAPVPRARAKMRSAAAPLLLAALALALGPAAQVAADVPVHCLASDVFGRWNVTQWAPPYSATAGGSGACAGASADSDAGWAAGGGQRELVEFQVDLAPPNLAHVVGEGEEESDSTFTMTYDEGIEIRLGPRRLFAFFRNARATATARSPDNAPSAPPGSFLSFCGATAPPGWVSARGAAGGAPTPPETGGPRGAELG
eukprot:CAMPEP_0180268108 /NCGR_PEP_ID=MMETSP0988-20121125/1927_1 /TAXON_ID=697907 /ORGANISM="non described non described, Strain CCMP2293" /LENGTH=201 /DNA_ID=CAMNT_0022238873 /DNA_START=20 /DNA_END=621 /DNA_ORIENTATION=+